MRNFLVGMYLVATTGTLHICRIASTLNGLPPATRKRLGLTRPGGITDRQVQRLFNTDLYRPASRRHRQFGRRI